MQKYLLILAAATLTIACEQPPKQYTPREAQTICESERRDAQGPRTDLTLGASSQGGAFGGVSVSINDKFLRGVDPQVAYDQCIERLSPHIVTSTN